MNKFLSIITVLSLCAVLSLGLVQVSYAQNGTTTDVLNQGTGAADQNTVALPDTGAGGDAATNIALLLASGAVMAGAAVYLTRRTTA